MQKDLCLSNRYCAVWIGCKSGYQTENFTCSGITQASIFTNWVSEFREIESSCAYMSNAHNGKWYNNDCSTKLFVVCEMSRQLVHVYSLTMAADGRVKPQCLYGHEIKNVTAKGVIKCGDACWAEPRCRSFNLWQGGQPEICQLNDATLLESDKEDVIYDDECNYFGL